MYLPTTISHKKLPQGWTWNSRFSPENQSKYLTLCLISLLKFLN